LVARVAPRRLLIAALALIFAGFPIYWGVDWPPAAIAGVIVIGLGIAPLLPLVSGFAGAAASAEGAMDLAAMRLAIALGPRAAVGPAHLAPPALIVAASACFFLGRALQRRESEERMIGLAVGSHRRLLPDARGALLPAVVLAVRPAWRVPRPSHCIGLATPFRGGRRRRGLSFAVDKPRIP
jgi:hypothetical protein